LAALAHTASTQIVSIGARTGF